MENNVQRLTIFDRDTNSEFYFNNLTDGELTEIIQSMNDFDDVSSALTELSSRNKNSEVTEFSYKILEKQLGDEFLQATAFNLLYGNNLGKAINIAEKRKNDASPALLGEIMSNLATNSSQPFEKTLSKDFLQSIINRFLEFSDDERESINDDYEWFVENYETKIK